MIRSISGLASLMLSSDRAPPPSWASRGMWWRAPLSVLRRSDTVAVEADADGAMSMEVGTGRGGGAVGAFTVSLTGEMFDQRVLQMRDEWCSLVRMDQLGEVRVQET